MKRFFSLALLSCLTLLLAICTGCAGLTSTILKPITRTDVIQTTVTNFVTLTVPGPVQTLVVTQMVAGATVTVTNTFESTRVITNTVIVPGPVVTNTVVVGYQPNDQFVNGVGTLSAINASFNPTPSAPVVEWGLGLLTVAAAAFARIKTAQLNKSNTALVAVTAVKDTLQTGIETYPSESTKDIKAHIEQIANAMGTQSELKSDLVAKGLSKA